MTKATMPYREALPASADVMELLGPCCERIEIVGAIRRLRRCVNDVAIVAIPKVIPSITGEPWNVLLFEIIDREVKSGRWHARHGHSIHARSSRYAITGRGDLQLDITLAMPTQWGVMLAVHTGPADYAQRIVVERYRGGLLDDGYQVQDSKLWFKNIYESRLEQVPTPEEDDFLVYAGGWIEPHLRH